MSNLIGHSLGRYHILEPLGEGGMATVYKAYDTRLERDVAIKVIRTEMFGSAILVRLLERFKREAQALAKLTHPNIVSILDYGEYQGAPYLVMQYLAGGTLKQKLTKPIPYQDAVRLLIPIAQALAHAHGQNIIHRDVKPANILITRTGEPMLSDFGIAKLLDDEGTRDLTGTGVGIGTPEYMAPEQGMGQADERADIYALGIVFYEMATGRIPFRADTPMAILMKKNQEPLPRPKKFVPSLPDSVENVLVKALARDPNNRYQTAREFADALERLTRGETITREFVKPSKAKFNWLWAFVGAGGLVIVVVCVAIALVLRGTSLQSTAVPEPATATLISLPALVESPIVSSTAGMAVEQNNPTVMPLQTEITAEQNNPTAASLQTEITDEKGIPMRLVPAGEFTMGSAVKLAMDECKRLGRKDCEAGWFKDAEPPHPIFINSFYMDKYEVTNGQYKICVEAGVCSLPHGTSSYTRSSYYDNPAFDNYPVIQVDWYMAKAFCEWRAGRLPTEAEWEKAARGTDQRKYPWGEGLDCGFANYGNCVSEIGDTVSVGSFEKSRSYYGIYDMAGNVWEWVFDWYDPNYYVQSPGNNPQGPASGEKKVLRGGGFYTFNIFTLSINRGQEFPYNFQMDPTQFDSPKGKPVPTYGFRCSRSTP